MTTEPVGLAQMKACTGTTWEAGEFAAVTRRQLRSADKDLMHRVGIGASERVLDIAWCTANEALRPHKQKGASMMSSTLDVDWELRETGPTEARHGVLLLPGGACSAAFYNELTAEPALAGLRLVAATLPGHAGTPAPSDLSTRNYGRLAAQLAMVKRCDTVLGFSMGSTIALEMATTAGFTGPLILTGASFSRKAESTMLEVLDALARVTGALPYTFMRSMFGPMLKQSTIPAERQAELLAEFKRNQPKELRRLMRAYLRDLGREPLVGDRLRALEAPIWIVHADKGDGRLTTQERRSLADCPNVTVVTIPGRSFFLPNEHPAQLADLIVEALATVSAAPATTATPTPPPR